MPVLALMGHLPLVDMYVLPTRVTELGKLLLEANTAESVTASHNVPLAPEQPVALDAAEVMHVPARPLRLRTLIGKYNLQQRWHCEREC